MPATIIGSAGASWGLTAETGVLIQRSSAKTSREKNPVRNNEGEVVLISYYNATQTQSMEAVTLGATGLAAAKPGVALTVANAFPDNGVSAGLILPDDVEVSRVNTDFQKVVVNTTRYPLVTA